MSKAEDRSIDQATRSMLVKAEQESVNTVWDRFEEMQPQCRFGQLGVCCRNCSMGPCRINPFSKTKQQRGVCGATVDTIVARNFVRMIAGGAAAHSDHGRDIAHALLVSVTDSSGAYTIKDEEKLRTLADEFGIETGDRPSIKIAESLAKFVLEEFGRQHGELIMPLRAPEKRVKRWREAGVMPRGVDREIVETMHRTHIGVDTDYRNILLHGFRTSLSDGWGGSMLATDLSDVLFASPRPIVGQANLGMLMHDQVNVVVHGHEPTLSDVVCDVVGDPELIERAKNRGAKGINLVGMCCTANEILMRHGIPVAGNFLQQELALMTGVVDLMMVDVQCIMPSICSVADHFHTRVVTTSPKNKAPGATHIEFNEERAYEIAKEIVEMAIDNFPNRNEGDIFIPAEKDDLVAGFTAENVYGFLGGTYRSTYRPLNDAIIQGRIRGLAGVVGCNNPKIKHNYGHVEMAKELIKNDVLVVVTGCSAIADAEAGFLKPEAAFKYAGAGLREVCEAVGIPPILHVGSCVDNSRILIALTNVVLEGGLGEDISDLPVAGAAPEWMSEKAVSIASYFLASGVFTVLGSPFPILGSKKVTDFLCHDVVDIFGAAFAFESDPLKAAKIMIEHIDAKRNALKLKPLMYAS